MRNASVLAKPRRKVVICRKVYVNCLGTDEDDYREKYALQTCFLTHVNPNPLFFFVKGIAYYVFHTGRCICENNSDVETRKYLTNKDLCIRNLKVRSVNHPLPSNAEVEERVEIYLYSPSGP
jgi:hypothetical protein